MFSVFSVCSLFIVCSVCSVCSVFSVFSVYSLFSVFSVCCVQCVQCVQSLQCVHYLIEILVDVLTCGGQFLLLRGGQQLVNIFYTALNSGQWICSVKCIKQCTL